MPSSFVSTCSLTSRYRRRRRHHHHHHGCYCPRASFMMMSLQRRLSRAIKFIILLTTSLISIISLIDGGRCYHYYNGIHALTPSLTTPLRTLPIRPLRRSNNNNNLLQLFGIKKKGFGVVVTGGGGARKKKNQKRGDNLVEKLEQQPQNNATTLQSEQQQHHNDRPTTAGNLSICRIHSSSTTFWELPCDDDLTALADLRYQEWMLDGPPETRPSLYAFRLATAEIQQERIEEHAVPFLVRYRPIQTEAAAAAAAAAATDAVDSFSSSTQGANTPENDTTKKKDDSAVVVAAAELSPIEFQGCFDDEVCCSSSPLLLQKSCCNNVYNRHQYWYVTDVVTAKAYRRKGIAAQLMQALESHATNSSRSVILERTTRLDDDDDDDDEASPLSPLAQDKEEKEDAALLEPEGNEEVVRPVLLMHVKRDNQGALQFYQRLAYEIIGSQHIGGGNDTSVDFLKGVNTSRLAENAGISSDPDGQLLLGKRL